MSEVVPVSSSAQLTLLPYLAGWEPEPDRTTFAAGLHAGSALGIFVALRNDHTASTAKRALAFAVPAAVAGALGHKRVEKKLGGVAPTAALLGAMGVAMWAADRRPSRDPLSNKALNTASLAQVAALAPGTSRAGITLTALRAQQVDRDEAFRHTLHSSLPITLGAAALTALRARRAPEVLPTAAAAVSSYAAARLAGSRVERLIPAAAAYRVAVAGLVAIKRRQELHR